MDDAIYIVGSKWTFIRMIITLETKELVGIG